VLIAPQSHRVPQCLRVLCTWWFILVGSTRRGREQAQDLHRISHEPERVGYAVSSACHAAPHITQGGVPALVGSTAEGVFSLGGDNRKRSSAATGHLRASSGSSLTGLLVFTSVSSRSRTGLLGTSVFFWLHLTGLLVAPQCFRVPLTAVTTTVLVAL
jgi:hypothetical protein